MKMNHIGILVSNMERSIEFYRENFGMELSVLFSHDDQRIKAIQNLPEAAGRIGVVFKDNVRLELFEYSTPKPAPKDPNYAVSDHGISHFGVEIEDIEGMVKRMKAAGVRFHSEVQVFGNTKAAYGRDPDGNVFELLEIDPMAAGPEIAG